MAFCSECGYDMGDSNVCPICKTVIDVEVDNQDFSQNEENTVLPEFYDEQTVPVLLENEFRLKRNKKFVVLGFVGVLIIALIIMFANFGNSPKSLTIKTLEAIKNADINTLITTVPYEHIYEDEYIDYAGGIRNSFLQEYNVALMRIKLFTGIDLNNITWEVKKVKDCDEDELEDVQDYWDDNFDITVKNLKTVKVKVKDGNDDKIVNFSVVKIGTKWYMADNPLTFFDN